MYIQIVRCNRICGNRYRGTQLVTLPYLTLPYLTLNLVYINLVIIYYLRRDQLRIVISCKNTLNPRFPLAKRYLPGGAIVTPEPYWVTKTTLWAPSVLKIV